MRLALVVMSMTLVLLSSCKRNNSSTSRSATERSPASRSTRESARRESAARAPDVSAPQEEPESTVPNEPKSEPPARQPGKTADPAPRPEPPRQPAANVALAKGKMIVRVYGTPLDFPLDGLAIKNGTYRLSGQGMNFVGRMSQNVRIGQSVAIEPRVKGLGESELDLPQVGKTKVVSGQIRFDEFVGESTARVKGRIAFALQGPDGPTTFEGTFEVGIIAQ